MVAEVVLGVGGAVKETQFYEAVMNSHQRLTYAKYKRFLSMNLRQSKPLTTRFV